MNKEGVLKNIVSYLALSQINSILHQVSELAHYLIYMYPLHFHNSMLI